MAQPRSLALLASLVSLTTLALACASKFQIDPDGYCKDTGNANQVNCPGGGGGSNGGNNGDGGNAGVTGMGGGGGGTMGDGGAGAGGGDIKCDEGLSPCGDVCVDLKTDANNCGECVHDCNGSTCEAGSCKPQIIVSNEVAPYALVQDKASSLYWASPARIQDGSVAPCVRGASKSAVGGAAATFFQNTLIRSTSLAAAPNAFLYWGTLGNSPADTGTHRIARGTPGSQDGTPIFSGQFNVQYLALNASDRIYWTTKNDAAVRGGPVDGSGGFDVEISIQGEVGWVAVDGEQPYWIRKDGGEVRRRNMNAPATTNQFELVGKSTNPISVELGNGRVYWADRSEGIVRSIATSLGGEPDIEFSGKGQIEGFALENAVLYVVTLVNGPDSSKVLQVWRKNSRPEPFLLGQVAVVDPATYANGNPFGAAYVLFDAGFIYFADVGTLAGQSSGVSLSNNDGVIYRVAK